LNISLPSIAESGVSCHIPDYCTGIDCCVDVPVIQRAFHAYVLLDACNYKLSVGIEKLSFNLTLFDYEWGKVEHFYLQGVIRLE
jgi:hypothetical protein